MHSLQYIGTRTYGIATPSPLFWTACHVFFLLLFARHLPICRPLYGLNSAVSVGLVGLQGIFGPPQLYLTPTTPNAMIPQRER